MTQQVELADVRWMAIRRGDLPQEEKIDLSGGRLRCAAPQGLCYAPGTVEEASHLASMLGKIGKCLPTAVDVKWALHHSSLQLSHYQFEQEGDIWYLRCVTARPELGAAINSSDWVLLFDTGKGWLELPPLESPLADILQLFPLLNGGHSLADALDFCATGPTPEWQQVVQLLLDYKIIRLASKPSKSALEIPNFLFLGHAGFAVRVEQNIVLFDPLMSPENTTIGEHRFPSILNAASAVVLSHCHWDHVYPQTIFRIPRHVQIFVPRCANPTVMNPSIAQYLRALGFQRVVECSPGEIVYVGDIEIQFCEFYGESFGLDSVFDGLTYKVNFLSRSIFGTVDAFQNEQENMTKTIEQVAAYEPISLFMFGSSAQRHDPIYNAAGYRHFSNELRDRPDLHQYHPSVHEVLDWVRILKPNTLVPYAQFSTRATDAPSYNWGQLPQLRLDSSAATQLSRLGEDKWLRSLQWLEKESHTPVLWLQPGQGLTG